MCVGFGVRCVGRETKMTDSLKLAEMQRTSIEFERQRHLANWLIKSSPHMATPSTPLSTNGVVSGGAGSATGGNSTSNTSVTQSGNAGTKNGSSTPAGAHVSASGKINTTNPLFFLMSSNGTAGATLGNPNGVPASGGGKNSGPEAAVMHSSRAHPALSAVKGAPLTAATHHVEGRKPKLRRFNSHDTGANMFSVADFENARLARRNEIEMKQRLQRRMKLNQQGINGYASGLAGCGVGGGIGSGSLGGDCSTSDSKGSKRSNDSQTEPLPAEIFVDRFTLPRVVRISYKTKFSHETLQSSSSNGSSTVTTNSSTQSSNGTGGMIGAGPGAGNGSENGAIVGSGTGTSSSTASSNGNITNSNTNTTNSNHNNNDITVRNHRQASGSSFKHGGQTNAGNSTYHPPTNGLSNTQGSELYLLYRLVRDRHIYHGFNAKSGVANRKKNVMIPQEFPGYFSLINEKGLPTAALYTSLIQLVRERVYKFVSVENMPAFTESQPNPVPATQTNEVGLPGGYIAGAGPSQPSPHANRPHYVKTTARGGQVFRLLAVFEDGKQDHSNNSLTYKQNSSHGREKEKGRYAQLLNEQRQVLYVSLGTKGKFYEIEPGIPQILQKLGGSGADNQRKVNADCVHRITALITPHKELPHTLRFISGSTSSIPDQVTISRISTETVIVACPIDDVEAQSPLQLRKLHLSPEMQFVKCSLGFETEQRMFANPNVQNILKFCQFNCDQFLRMVEVEVISRTERSVSKSRGGDALRILKPLHLPKLLRREKTAIAHEKEESIIFLSKHDLANLEAKEQQKRHAESSSSNRISDKMKVFQTTKKKWFRRQDKHTVSSLTSLDLDVQAKRLSMERYNDMSKLLQERFGDKCAGRANGISNVGDESISEPSVSEIGCSDTETTTLHSTTTDDKLQKFGKTKPLLQKSQSLQDVELIGCGKPDLVRSHHTATADTISEAGTDIEDMENRPPSSNADGQLSQTSFITEKLYTEFHVKTRQYSKSSSSLHQLIHFSAPQKMQLHEHKQQRSTLAHLKQQQLARVDNNQELVAQRKLDFNIGEPVTGRRAAGGLSLLAANGAGGGSFSSCGLSQNTSLVISPLSPNTFLEDDLPYSSVRDSLVLSSDESGNEQSTPGKICQALHMIDYAKENIYAEICHDAVAMGGLPRASQPLRIDEEGDEYGDYASLTPPYMSIGGGGAAASGAAQAISRVHINCSSSPVSYHTVYLGDEPLGEQYAAARKSGVRPERAATSPVGVLARSYVGNVTTVECVPSVNSSPAIGAGASNNNNNNNYHHRHHHHHHHHHHQHNHHRHSNDDNHPSAVAEPEPVEGVDNIYNTLK